MKIEELPERIEYKYFVPLMIRPHLLGDLEKFTSLDPHIKNEEKFYRIASIYFENYKLKSYHDKLDGQAKRVKLRLRFYPPLTETACTKVEFKYKVFDRCIKETAQMNYDELCQLCSGELTAFNDENKDKNKDKNSTLSQFIRITKLNNFHPFIRIDYNRRALFADSDRNVRITYDFDVKSCRFMGDIHFAPHIPVLSPDLGILEIKTPNYIPFWLTKIIKKYSLMRSAISKYGFSVQNLTVNSSMGIK